MDDGDGPCSAPYSINLKSEEERLKTFKNWPVSYLEPTSLARSGFYYTQYEDEVQCTFCGLQMSGWKQGYDPQFFHAQGSSDCDFLKNRDCGNIPLRRERDLNRTETTVENGHR